MSRVGYEHCRNFKMWLLIWSLTVRVEISCAREFCFCCFRIDRQYSRRSRQYSRRSRKSNPWDVGALRIEAPPLLRI